MAVTGTAVNRVEAPDKVTGAARYSADRVPDRLAYGHLVLSTIANGTVREVRVDAVRNAPGVLAVYTPFAPLRYTGPVPDSPIGGPIRFPLQPGDLEVRHHGQVVALVLAETIEQARDAAALVETVYDARTPNTSFDDGIPDAVVPPPLGPGAGPVVDKLAEGVGSIDEALAASEVTVSASYSQRPEHHNAMEPHAAVASWGGDGTLTIHSGTQGPLLHAYEIAAAMEVDVRSVRVVSPYVGGAFGGKVSTWPPAVLAAAAARELRRPVKLTLTREQLYSVTGHRPTVVQTVTLGANRDGTLRAVKHDSVSSRSASSVTYNGASNYSTQAYRTPNLHVEARAVDLDIPPTAIMRAPTDEAGSFALECAMDELAHELGLDPVELRRVNDADRDPVYALPYSSKHLDECLSVGADRFGWSHRNPVPRSLVDGEWLVGMGMATAVFEALRPPMSTRVTFRRDGTVAIGAATSDAGTGMGTVLAIVTADSLGVPVERVEPVLGDNTVPSGETNQYMGVAAGSSSAGATAPAVRAAAQTATTALINHAVTHERSPFHGLPPEDVRYHGGVLSAAGRDIEFGRLLTTTGISEIAGEATSAPGQEVERYAMCSFAAHFSEVRVNRFTGEARVSRMTTVVDAGAIINASAARNQIVGGLVWGLSQALFEGADVEPATGRIANGNLADYLVPVNADVPDIDVVFLDHPDTIFSPVGSRGVGEIGTVGSGAAIANAIFNATGIRVRDLPISPEKLL